jgi:formate hydrogenlyase subunit 3/multisubunit Na+/H+ antiporter MnhD subunit
VSGTGLLLVATLAVPVGMLFACLSRTVREGMPRFLGLAPLPALAAALLAADGPPLVLDEAGRQFALALDSPGAILLGVAALLWSIAGIYARTYIGVGRAGGRFAEWWLLTLVGSLGVFIAADLVSFYAAFAVVSLAAWGLVVHDGTARARRAGVIYLGLAVFGEICLLMAFTLLAMASPGDSLAIREVVAQLPQSPWRGLTIALLVAGFGLKMGLVPLHVWLPIAHPAAPMPASAVLSGAIIKAGVIGLIRFLPFEVALPEWGVTLTALGLLTAFYGALIGITQANPKTVLAYSSVSQMGLVAAVLGMGLATGGGGATPAAAFYAAHHVLTKGALFLAVGVVATTGARRLWPVLLPAAVLALGFGGLPLTGGALAKLAVKAPLGAGVVGLLATLAAVASTLLMLHFLFRLRSSAASDPRAAAPPGLVWPWLGLAGAAVAVPWALFLSAGIGSVAEALAPSAVWELLWPVLLGVVLAAALRRFAHRLPPVPEGDVLALGGPAARIAGAWGDWLVRAEGVLRQWPAAGVSLLTLAVILGAVLVIEANLAPR